MSWNNLLLALTAIKPMEEETELQLVEIVPEKTNEDRLKELLDKMNNTLEKIEQRKKNK